MEYKGQNTTKKKKNFLEKVDYIKIKKTVILTFSKK